MDRRDRRFFPCFAERLPDLLLVVWKVDPAREGRRRVVERSLENVRQCRVDEARPSNLGTVHLLGGTWSERDEMRG